MQGLLNFGVRHEDGGLQKLARRAGVVIVGMVVAGIVPLLIAMLSFVNVSISTLIFVLAAIEFVLGIWCSLLFVRGFSRLREHAERFAATIGTSRGQSYEAVEPYESLGEARLR
ncbi:MAG: hypothetical protein QM811_06610 [Pirellulales bacterium]